MSEYDQMRLYREGVARSQAIADKRKKATSDLKPYGWGIVASDGRHINYATDTTKAEFCKNMYDALSTEDSPHRVVQLFYKEEE